MTPLHDNLTEFLTAAEFLPCERSLADIQHRWRVIIGEHGELQIAIAQQDIVSIAHEATDLAYASLGAVRLFNDRWPGIDDARTSERLKLGNGVSRAISSLTLGLRLDDQVDKLRERFTYNAYAVFTHTKWFVEANNLPFFDLWAIIHESNMKKKPFFRDFKGNILKPRGWVNPREQITNLLSKNGRLKS